MAKNSGREEEPSFAPVPDIWYDLRLGPSFRDHHPSSKFCSLRYECKPASVDKNHPGSLHKRKDNRVFVEFQNNRHAKPKVVFEGITDDYKNDGAVLFFDGQTFRLEQLHRAVEHLRYVHQPGESAAASVGPAPESHLPPVGKAAGQQFSNPSKAATQVEVERMDSGDLESLGGKQERGLRDEVQPHPASTALLEDSNYESSEENVDIMDDEDDAHQVAKEEDRSRLEVHRGIDINLPHREDEEDEIADVDVSDDELNAGCNAAEALRAQVAGEKEAESSSSTSSSSSSESSSSESESSSGSSGSESRSSSADSVTSV